MGATTAARLADEWRHFERHGLCRLNVVEPGTCLQLGCLSATWFAYAPCGFLSGFLLEDGHSRALLALDETRDLAGLVTASPALQGCDLLIAECGWFERDPDGRVIVPAGSSLREREANFERDTLPLIAAARARRTVLTHLSEIQGRTPVELDALAATLAPLRVRFANDGLVLDL
jgi:hypothetical protein